LAFSCHITTEHTFTVQHLKISSHDKLRVRALSQWLNNKVSDEC